MMPLSVIGIGSWREVRRASKYVDAYWEWCWEKRSGCKQRIQQLEIIGSTEFEDRL